MKKLMIAAAIVCAAVVSQAATAQWSFNNLDYDPSAKGPAYTAYLMNAADLSIEDAISAIEKGNFSFVSDAVASASTIQQGTLSRSRINTVYTGDVFTKGTSYTLYTVVLNDGAKSTYGYVSEGITSEAPETGYQNAMFQNLATGDYKGTWHAAAVPEPTSGLLLLLGVAGMALRRRRA